ncbi:MAG: divalent-cation tolerance protein CutA [Candidatus Odinarchaeum yellowstonii]|uniref:Divalent-cation tolerance protein CutA n=1 Tax=Odinarchaeota yellowstonii (strain LCB_4) TaxID=1841599 RepID=A0AAF0IBF9_ODILC|nr:MAG: divalent-cation tolerance protein CutA [Candidatus Odinarchaeum yellowstonii]
MYITVFVTTSNPVEAENISKKIIENKLAACVSIVRDITSIYTWKNKIERSSECLLIIKTLEEKYSELEKTIIENHSYEIPEIISVKINTGYERYLNWIFESVKG